MFFNYLILLLNIGYKILRMEQNCKKYYKGNNKITELRTILQRESQNSLYKQTKSVNNRKTVKTVMILTWYRHF
jgi:hypothetical protein